VASGFTNEDCTTHTYGAWGGGRALSVGGVSVGDCKKNIMWVEVQEQRTSVSKDDGQLSSFWFFVSSVAVFYPTSRTARSVEPLTGYGSARCVDRRGAAVAPSSSVVSLW
jgi:hypothetical protein